MDDMQKTILISEDNFQKAREQIKKNSDKIIIFSGNDEINRKILEKEKIDILLPKLSNRKDKLRQRNSGFNQVLAKLALKNNVKIGINLDEIISNSLSKIEKATILSRIRQNIEICKKNKLSMVFIKNNSIVSPLPELRAFGLVIKMPTWMTKNL